MEKPKFNLVEILFGSLVALVIDIVSAIADVAAGIGGFFIQSLTWLLFTLWFTLKGATATANLVRRFLVPIGVQIIPVLPTQIFTFLVSVYMENHPEKFSLVTTAVSVSKMDVKKIKEVKETKGTFAAVKETRTQYRTARKEFEDERMERGEKDGEKKKSDEETYEYKNAA